MEIKVCHTISMQICAMELCAKRNKKLKTSARSAHDLIAFWALQSSVPRTNLKSNPAHIIPESCNLTLAYTFHRHITYHYNLSTLHKTRDLTCHSLYSGMWVFRKQESEITVKYHRVRCWIFNMVHGRGVKLDELQGPFLPKPFCNSVILYHLLVPRTGCSGLSLVDFECLQEWRPHTLSGQPAPELGHPQYSKRGDGQSSHPWHPAKDKAIELYQRHLQPILPAQ